MPGFCVSCGSPLGGQSGFCGGCGARAGNASPGPPATTSAPIARKSGALKIVLIVAGVIFLFGVLSVGGMYYAAHRYIRMAEAATGVHTSDVVDSIRDAVKHDSRGAKEPKRDGCLLLTKEEASAILGIEVERVDGKPSEQDRDEHCNFFVKPQSVEQNAEDLKKSLAALKNDSPDVADISKTYARGMSEGMGDGKTPYFGFTVERENGKIAYTAFQMARRLSGVDALSDKGTAEPPLDVGDQAIMGIGDSQLCVVKGRYSITLNLTQVTEGRAKGVALARKILPRL